MALTATLAARTAFFALHDCKVWNSCRRMFSSFAMTTGVSLQE